jgi:hypothetical protein
MRDERRSLKNNNNTQTNACWNSSTFTLESAPYAALQHLEIEYDNLNIFSDIFSVP